LPRLALLLAILAAFTAALLDATDRPHALAFVAASMALIAYACSERV
jgi:hypothetical protein